MYIHTTYTHTHEPMSHDSTRPWTPRGDRPIERVRPSPRARETRARARRDDDDDDDDDARTRVGVGDE